MDKDTKIIFALLALMAMLTCVFVLKVAGIIKPVENKDIEIEENIISESINDLEQEEHSFEDEPINNLEEDNQSNDKYDFEELLNIQTDINRNFFTEWYFTLVMKYRLFIFIITIILSIGISIMYKKIEMPVWTVILQLCLPFLNLINVSAIETIIYILRFISLILLYKKLDSLRIEMNLYKSVFISTILIILAIILINLNLNILYFLLAMLAALVVILAIMFHIKMSSNLAETFNKNIGFKIGLIFLPTIFQAILGYEKN